MARVCENVRSHESVRPGRDLPLRRVAAALFFTVLPGPSGRARSRTRTSAKPTNAASNRPRAVAGRFPVRFYLIAMLFVVFDVEAASFYPWAVQMHALRVFGLLEMVVVHRRARNRIRIRVEERRLRMAVTSMPGGQFMLARLDDVARWAQSSSAFGR